MVLLINFFEHSVLDVWPPVSQDTLRFELRHKEIVDRSNRYPHRNALLGRTTTPEELAYLSELGSSFKVFRRRFCYVFSSYSRIFQVG
ncbi:DUF924 family protein [Rhodoferax potami]|uniref:DUF924 family protein n=1 Tax=Rhodoferax potami TaxID=3068338 RepID=UPI0028BEA535|nr:DUF924 family protein [Rhodoferax sp. TBRC 17198]